MTNGDMLGVILSWIVVGIACFLLGSVVVGLQFMQEAYNRGYAVECLGKSGYYWECEE